MTVEFIEIQLKNKFVIRDDTALGVREGWSRVMERLEFQNEELLGLLEIR